MTKWNGRVDVSNSAAKVEPSSVVLQGAAIYSSSPRKNGSAVVCRHGKVISLDQLATEAQPVGASSGGGGQCIATDNCCCAIM